MIQDAVWVIQNIQMILSRGVYMPKPNADNRINAITSLADDFKHQSFACKRWNNYYKDTNKR